ncbi:MAG: hypothetical protein KAX31_06395 [Thermoplasmata archaeon]|nr:hypothetical protein [Thermoplasmata archaeon]
MLSIYLDTNIYIVGLLDEKTNSGQILKELFKRDIVIVQSDYLFDEILQWFRSRRGRNILGLIRTYLLTIPHREFINKAEWSYFIERVSEDVDDDDDLPHICGYIAGGAEYFVTTNRKLTQMNIKDKVNFISPRKFLEKIGAEFVDSEW